MKKRIELDLWYINNWSLWVDFRRSWRGLALSCRVPGMPIRTAPIPRLDIEARHKVGDLKIRQSESYFFKQFFAKGRF